jgi:dihydrofolate reductase
MARFIFAMNLSLDGFVDHDRFAPDPVLFRHWIDQTRASSGGIYGRKIYDLMRYWENDEPGWGPAERDFAAAWRSTQQWVVSTTLTEVGPNATLICQDVEARVRALKAELTGDIDVGGTQFAQYLAGLGLLDEYRLYYHPVVLGQGRPFFVGQPPPLRLIGHDQIGDRTVRLAYVPA